MSCLLSNSYLHFMKNGEYLDVNNVDQAKYILLSEGKFLNSNEKAQLENVGIDVLQTPTKTKTNQYAVLLDISGSMDPVQRYVTKDVISKYPSSTITMVEGCGFHRGFPMTMEVENALTRLPPGSDIFVFADFFDGSNEEVVNLLKRKAIEKTIKIYLKSYNRKPDKCLELMAYESGGSVVITHM